MQVKDLTIDELKSLIRETVLEVLEDFLPDPNESMTVKEQLQQGLLEIQKRGQAGNRRISAQEAMSRLGLDS